MAVASSVTRFGGMRAIASSVSVQKRGQDAS
jgi:hypothetical protein